MTDQSPKKADAGKARYDLLPWHEFDAGPIDHGVEAVAGSLRLWWAGRPYRADFSIPQRQIRGIATVLAFGAAKYEDRNWEGGLRFSLLFAAAQRHAAAYLGGELLDPESGLPHESHFYCNVLFLVVFTARGRTDLDDRPTAVPAVVAQLDRVQALINQLTGVDQTPPTSPTAKDN